jgi:DNA-binding IclR family transcriptional regulator
MSGMNREKKKSAEAGKVAKDRQFVTSLSRGLSVLSCFAQARRDLGTMDVSRLSGLPQATVWRLCHTLLEMGYLVQAPSSERMRLGIPILGLGYAALAGQSIAQMATPYMQNLAEECKGAVALGAPDGLDIIYLQRCQGPSVLLTDLEVGARIPIAQSATGWGYLAGLPAASLDKFMRDLRKKKGKDAALEKRILSAMEGYRKTGYVLGIGVLHQEINSIAAPILGPDGVSALTLSCGGQASVFTKQALLGLAPSLLRLAKIIALGLPNQTSARD